jgi:hypothetical protein
MLKIKNNNKDNVIKFTLTKKSEKVSSKEDYETYVNNISEKNIIFSPNEETTFYKPESNFTITPFFKGFENQSLSFNSYVSALYTEDELKYINDNLKKSFYIFSLYDSYNSNNQKLITQFKINAGEKYTYTIIERLITPKLKYFNQKTLIKPFNIFPIVENKIKNNTIYLKIVFFNSKNGLFTYFNTHTPSLLTTEEKNYIPINLNTETKTYSVNSNINNNIELVQSQVKDNFEFENDRSLINKNTLSPINDSNDNISFGIDNLLKKFKI